MSTLWAGCWASSHFDNNRYIWAYRDYLIKSFNSNKPFDQFAKEEIAGDLLPANNLDQIIASAYVRSGVSRNEGGTHTDWLQFLGRFHSPGGASSHRLDSVAGELP